MSDNQLVFDLTPLDLIEENGDKFVLHPDGEGALLAWKQFLKAVKAADDKVKERLMLSMQAHNTLKVEGEKVKVVRQYYGQKYEVLDPQLASEAGFVEKVEKFKVVTKEVDKFVKSTEELPEGIKLRDRVQKVTIKYVDEGEEDEDI